MNKKIALVLIVVLSMASLYIALAPKTKADVSDIKILSYSWYVSPADSYTSWKGDFVVVGEIQNTGSQTIDLPQVQAIAYTTDGQPVASAYTSAYVKDLLPQQKAPFYLDFTSQSTATDGNYSGTLDWIPFFDHVTVNVGYAEATQDTMYRGLNVAAKTSYNTNDVFSVTGIIQNNGSELTGQVWAVTTFYNTTGAAIAVNYTNYLTTSLAPNGTVQFTATPIDNTASLSSQINSYSILIQTKAPDNSTVSSPTTGTSQSPNPSATPAGSEQPTQSPQAQQSSTSPELIYIVIGAVVAVVIIVAAVLFLRKKR